MGVDDLGMHTPVTTQQAVRASQVDAIAAGRLRLSGSGLSDVAALFDTSARAHASCYGQAVAYLNHDNAGVGRLRKIYDMEPHDLPIADGFMGANEYVVRRKGMNGKDMVYNHEKLREPLLEFHNEFQPDTAVSPLPYPGKAMDLLNYQTYIWGGQSCPTTSPSRPSKANT